MKRDLASQVERAPRCSAHRVVRRAKGQWVCPRCANLLNERITHDPHNQTLLDGKPARLYRTASTRQIRCDDCGQKSRDGWASDRWATRPPNVKVERP